MRQTTIPAILGMNTDIDPIKLNEKFAREVVNFRLDSSGNAVLIEGYDRFFSLNGFPPNTTIRHIERFEEYLTGEVSWFALTSSGVYKYSLSGWLRLFQDDIDGISKELSVLQYQNKIFVADKNNPAFYILPRGAAYISGGGAGLPALYGFELGVGEMFLNILNQSGSQVLSRTRLGLPPTNPGSTYRIESFYPNSEGDIPWVVMVMVGAVCVRTTLYLYIAKSGRVLSKTFENEIDENDTEFDQKTLLLDFDGINYGTKKQRDAVVLFSGNLMIIKNKRDAMRVFSFKYEIETPFMSFVHVATKSHPAWDSVPYYQFNSFADQRASMLLTTRDRLFFQHYMYQGQSYQTYGIVDTKTNEYYLNTRYSQNVFNPGTQALYHFNFNGEPITGSTQYPFIQNPQLLKSSVSNDNEYTIADIIETAGVSAYSNNGFTKIWNNDRNETREIRMRGEIKKNGVKVGEDLYSDSYMLGREIVESGLAGDGFLKEMSFFCSADTLIENVIDNQAIKDYLKAIYGGFYVDKNNVYSIRLVATGKAFTLQRQGFLLSSGNYKRIGAHIRNFKIRAIITKGKDGEEKIADDILFDYVSTKLDFFTIVNGNPVLKKALLYLYDYRQEWEYLPFGADFDSLKKFWFDSPFISFINGYDLPSSQDNNKKAEIAAAIINFSSMKIENILRNQHLNTSYYKGTNEYEGFNSPSILPTKLSTKFWNSSFDNDMLWYIDAPPLFDVTEIGTNAPSMVYPNLDIHISYRTEIGETLKTKLQKPFSVNGKAIRINFFRIFKDLKYAIDGINVYFYSSGNLIGTDFIPIGTNPDNPEDPVVVDFNLNPYKDYDNIPKVSLTYAGQSFMNNPHIMTEHLERIILAGDEKYPDYEYYSMVLFPEVFQGSAGGGSAGIGTRPIKPNDGDNITANLSLYDRLYIFKNNRTYVIVGDINSQESIMMLLSNNIGCIAHKSAKVIDNKIYFLSNLGICVLVGNDIKILSENRINNFIFKNEKITAEERVDSFAVHYASRNQYRLYIGAYVIVYDLVTKEFYTEDKLPFGHKYTFAKQINTDDGQDYILFSDTRGIPFVDFKGKLFFDKERWAILRTKLFKLSEIGKKTIIYNLFVKLFNKGMFSIGTNGDMVRHNSQAGEQRIRVRNKPSDAADITVLYNGTDEFGVSIIGIEHE